MTRYTNRQIQQMSDAQVAQALTEDFLERDGKTFVRIRRNGRLGWEDTLPKGSAYSERMLSPRSEEELLKGAYSHACDMITAMNTPFRIQLRVSGDSSWTNSKVVHVASDMLQDKTMSIGQRLDVFTGYAVHEGSHLLYTDFGSGAKKKGILSDLHNILEDEMIEMKLGEEKPGFANFLCAAKYHAFGRYEKKKEDLKISDETALVQVMNAILFLVRYPARLDDEIIAKHGRFLLKVRQVITPYPSSTRETLRAAEKILELIREEYDDQVRKQHRRPGQPNGEKQQRNDSDSGSDSQKDDEEVQNTGEEAQKDDPSEDNTGNEKDGKKPEKRKEADDDNASEENGCDDNEDTDDAGNGAETEDKDEDTDGNDGSRPSDEDQEETDDSPEEDYDLTPEEMDRLAQQMLDDDYKTLEKALKELFSDGSAPTSRDRMADGFRANNKILARECEGEFTRGTQQGTVIIDAPQDSAGYLKSLNRVKKYIPAVSRILRSNGTEYKDSLRGLRSGKLDPCKIAEAFQGVQSVYMREGQVKADRMTIALLVDESGSMDRDKIQAARDTSVLFAEALRSVPNVTLHIYGYTSEEFALELFRYIEPGYGRKHALGSMTGRSYTPTRQAIAEVTGRIAPKNGEKVLLIVLSDGCPDGGLDGVAQETAKAERKGIKVMGISIDDGLPESALRKMYGNYVKYNDMASMVGSLGKTLKKAVLEGTTKRLTQ